MGILYRRDRSHSLIECLLLIGLIPMLVAASSFPGPSSDDDHDGQGSIASAQQLERLLTRVGERTGKSPLYVLQWLLQSDDLRGTPSDQPEDDDDRGGRPHRDHWGLRARGLHVEDDYTRGGPSDFTRRFQARVLEDGELTRRSHLDDYRPGQLTSRSHHHNDRRLPEEERHRNDRLGSRARGLEDDDTWGVPGELTRRSHLENHRRLPEEELSHNDRWGSRARGLEDDDDNPWGLRARGLQDYDDQGGTGELLRRSHLDYHRRMQGREDHRRNSWNQPAPIIREEHEQIDTSHRSGLQPEDIAEIVKGGAASPLKALLEHLISVTKNVSDCR